MNRWSSRKDALATWRADVAIDAAHDWIRRLLDAGEEHAVYLTRDALQGKDERELARDFWLSRYDHANGRYPAGARMAFFRGAEGVREDIVDDLGALSAALHPELSPEEHILELRCRAPVMIEQLASRERRAFAIVLHSDIWMPWIWGFLEDEPRFPDGEPFDNRVLAARHTPRLNAFLADVRAASEAAGGSLEVETEDAGTPFYYAYCVGRDGIDLDARP